MKKIVATLLSLTVVLILLTACGSAWSEERVAPVEFEEQRAMYEEPCEILP